MGVTLFISRYARDFRSKRLGNGGSQTRTLDRKEFDKIDGYHVRKSYDCCSEEKIGRAFSFLGMTFYFNAYYSNLSSAAAHPCHDAMQDNAYHTYQQISQSSTLNFLKLSKYPRPKAPRRAATVGDCQQSQFRH
jgi:hypothetical protein